MLARAAKSLAGGVSSPFRARVPRPLYFRDGCGARLEDVDGNNYIDYTLAWGPNILGYKHPKIVEAMTRAAQGPHTYGAQHELEYMVAEKIQSMAPCAERVAFSSSGSEVVQFCWRLARAFTSRETILKFEGHYHGWMDSVLISYHPTAAEAGPADAPAAALHSRGQVANARENIAVARWNLVDAVEQELARQPIAAVVMEPVMCNSGCILPRPGYLEAVRDLCKKYGALLIFDEVITGFRMTTGGAQKHYGVTPDLATFGKAVGGGLPLSVVAGRQEILEMAAGGGVAFGGTFNGNPVSLAAAHAALEELSNGALDCACRAGTALMDGISRIARERHVDLLVCGFPTAFAIHFTARAELVEYRDTWDDDTARLSAFIHKLMDEGVYILPDGRMYVSAAHGDAEVRETLDAFERALS